MSISTQSIAPKHIFGFKADTNGSVFHVDESKIIYVAGHNIVIYHTDDRVMQFFSGHDSSQGISCISLSPLRRHLAVAEKGDPAIITVYDTHTQRKKKMMQSPDCQSQEYVSMAFAPGQENKFLITLGGAPDWLLIYWQWERPRALSYIRVSMANPVYQISFNMQDHNYGIIVTGDDVFGWYKLIDNNLRAQTTEIHNSEEHLSRKYLCHCWLKDGRLVVGTNNGEILVLDANCEYLGFIEVGLEEFEITSMISFENGFLAGGSRGQVLTFISDGDERNPSYRQQSRIISAEKKCTSKIKGLSLPFQTEDRLIMTLENAQIYSIDFISDNDIGRPLSYNFHCGQITGLDVCVRKPLVVTCGSDNSVKIWNYMERTLEIDWTFNEEPYSVAFHPSGFHIVVGFSDKLRMMNVSNNVIRSYKDINMKNVREVKFSQGGHLFAAASASMIKVFNFYTAESPPGFEYKAHSARVNSIVWNEDDTGFVSCGMDGAVYEWHLYPKAGASHAQEHHHKGCVYTSVIVTPDTGASSNPGESGRTIYAVGTDHFLKEIQDSSVPRQYDTVQILGQIALSHSGRLLFAGVSEPDRPGAVRCYKFSPLSGDYTEFQAHNSPIERMSVSHDDCYLFTAGRDGCLIIWEVKDKDIRALRREKEALGLAYAEEIMITKGEIEELNQQIENLYSSYRDLEANHKMQLELAVGDKADTIEKLKEQLENDAQQDKNRYDSLAESKKELDTQFEELIRNNNEQFEVEKQEMETEHQAKFMVEVSRYQELSRDKEAEATAAREKIAALKKEHERIMEKQRLDFEQEMSDYHAQIEKLRQENEEVIKKDAMIIRQLEEENEQEIREVEQTNQLELKAIKSKSSSDRGKLNQSNNRQKKLYADKEQLDDELKSKNEQFEHQKKQIEDYNVKIKKYKKEIQDKDKTIGEKERKIYELKQRNQNLEKFKFVLDYKIRELKREIGPREEQIAKMKEQTSKMDRKLKKLSGINENLGGFVDELRRKQKQMQDDITNQRDKIRSSANKIKAMKDGIYDCVQYIQDIRKLKECILRMFNTYVKTEGRAQEPETEKEFARQCKYLEVSIQTLREKLKVVQEVHQQENYKIMQENMQLIDEIHNLREERSKLKHVKRQYEQLTQKQQPKASQRLEEDMRLIERNKDEIRDLRRRLGELEDSRPSTSERLPPLET